MKKKIITAVLAISCVGLSVGSAFAAPVSCNGVSITGIGTTSNSAIASGLVVQLRNDSPAACGSLAKGAVRQYALSTTNTDQTYATLLTALSLQKKLFVQVGGDVANSLLLVATIKN
jgi:hypothetical protein